jgi:opacity protein-like surface antigen
MSRNGMRALAVAAALGLGVLAWSSSAAIAADTQQQASLGFKGLGAHIGLVDPENASSTVALGVHIDGGEFVRNVHFSPLVEYWSVGSSIAGYNLDRSDFSVGTDVTVDFPVQGSRVVPYAGGGLGLHFLGIDSNVPNVNTDTRSKLGLNIQGGIRNDVMPNMSLFGEVRYNFVDTQNQLKILGGFTYHFIY